MTGDGYHVMGVRRFLFLNTDSLVLATTSINLLPKMKKTAPCLLCLIC